MDKEVKDYEKVKCPFCNIEIDYVIEEKSIYTDYTFYPNGKYVEILDNDNIYDVDEYHCPKCDGIIIKTMSTTKSHLNRKNGLNYYFSFL